MLGEGEDTAGDGVAGLLEPGDQQEYGVGVAFPCGERRLAVLLSDGSAREDRGEILCGFLALAVQQLGEVRGHGVEDLGGAGVDRAGPPVHEAEVDAPPVRQPVPVRAGSAQQQGNGTQGVELTEVLHEVGPAAPVEGGAEQLCGDPAHRFGQPLGDLAGDGGPQQPPDQLVPGVVHHGEQHTGVHAHGQVLQVRAAPDPVAAALGGEVLGGRGGHDVGVPGEHPESVTVRGSPARVEEHRRFPAQPCEELVRHAGGEP